MPGEIEREDGFFLVHSGAGGWDIHAPAPDISDLELPQEILDLLEPHEPERRLGADPNRDGVERRKGHWFAWAEDLDTAEAKIADEKRRQLFHSPEKRPVRARESDG